MMKPKLLRFYSCLFLLDRNESIIAINPVLTRDERYAIQAAIEDIMPDAPGQLLFWLEGKALREKVVDMRYRILEWRGRAFCAVEFSIIDDLKPHEVQTIKEYATETLLTQLHTPLYMRPIHANGASFHVAMWSEYDSIWLSEKELDKLQSFMPEDEASLEFTHAQVWYMDNTDAEFAAGGKLAPEDVRQLRAYRERWAEQNGMDEKEMYVSHLKLRGYMETRPASISETKLLMMAQQFELRDDIDLIGFTVAQNERKEV